MKYIRTKDGRIIKFGEPTDSGYDKGTMEIQNKPRIVLSLSPFKVLKQSHSIEKLCDEFVVVRSGSKGIVSLKLAKEYAKSKAKAFGAIWTDKGLIYIAKMNEKGELELI